MLDVQKHILMPLNGATESMDEINRKGSASNNFLNVKNTPVLVIKAKNDPIIGENGINEE